MQQVKTPCRAGEIRWEMGAARAEEGLKDPWLGEKGCGGTAGRDLKVRMRVRSEACFVDDDDSGRSGQRDPDYGEGEGVLINKSSRQRDKG